MRRSRPTLLFDDTKADGVCNNGLESSIFTQEIAKRLTLYFRISNQNRSEILALLKKAYQNNHTEFIR